MQKRRVLAICNHQTQSSRHYSRKAVRPAANVCSTYAAAGRTTTTVWRRGSETTAAAAAAAVAVAAMAGTDGRDRRGSHRRGASSTSAAAAAVSVSYNMAKNFLGDSGLRTTTAAPDSVMVRGGSCDVCARVLTVASEGRHWPPGRRTRAPTPTRPRGGRGGVSSFSLALPRRGEGRDRNPIRRGPIAGKGVSFAAAYAARTSASDFRIRFARATTAHPFVHGVTNVLFRVGVNTSRRRTHRRRDVEIFRFGRARQIRLAVRSFSHGRFLRAVQRRSFNIDNCLHLNSSFSNQRLY